MKCQRCNENEATFFYEENINGQKKKLSLCAHCAEEMQNNGELQTISSPFEDVSFASPFAALSDSLFGGLFYPAEAAKIGTGAKKCGRCGSTIRDFRERGKAGCPDCYATFSAELEPTIRSMHGSASHMGRSPAKWKKKHDRADRMKALRTALDEAIRKEEFEEAARLRDEIRAEQGKETD